MTLYDIAIIGGGPAGYTAAERASAGGLKTIRYYRGCICIQRSHAGSKNSKKRITKTSIGGSYYRI